MKLRRTFLKSALLILFAASLPVFPDAPPLRVVMDDNYPPFTFRSAEGRLQGILVDQWRLWEEKTGRKVTLTGRPWDMALREMEAADFDVIDTMFRNGTREKRYDFSRPYQKIDVPAFFHHDIAGIAGIQDLRGFVIGVKAGDAVIEVLREAGITDLELFPEYEDIVEAAQEGKIRVFLMDRPPALYFLHRHGIASQYRETLPLYAGEFHRAVAKGNTGLIKTVQDGFDAISAREYADIEKKWRGSPLSDTALFQKIRFSAGIAVAVLLILIVWIVFLRRAAARGLTDKRVSQLLLRDSEDRFKTTVRTMEDLVFALDEEGRIVFCNIDDDKRLFIPRSNFLGKPPEDVLPPQVALLIRKAFEVNRTGRTSEYDYELSDDHKEHWFFVKQSPRFLDGVFKGSVAVIREITERKQAEARITASLQEKETLIRELYH